MGQPARLGTLRQGAEQFAPHEASIVLASEDIIRVSFQSPLIPRTTYGTFLPFGVFLGIVKVNWLIFSEAKTKPVLLLHVGAHSQILNQVLPDPADSVLAVGLAALM